MDIFVEFAGILLVAFIVSYIIRAFKQPVVVGYIISGMIIALYVSMSATDLGASKEIITIFSEFGIAFLLFIVGLHLNPKVIKEIGGSALLIGLGQIVVTFLIGFAVSYSILSYGAIASVYVGIALSFSSTIIAMKLLSDKRQLDSLHGKIAIGVLIIQDLVAIGVLMFISSTSNGSSLASFATRGLLSGSALIALLFFAGFFILPRLLKSIAHSQELLFLFSICWCFSLAALFAMLGFSMEIGALIAGVVLSISPYSTEVSSKIRPLRDFFLILFFIILGLNLPVTNLNTVIVDALILSLVALILKPIILMTFSAIFGYARRTNFLVGTTLAQISEFSIIVFGLALTAGHITSDLVATITLTAVITITFSSYMIIYSNYIYKPMLWFIKIFERKGVRRSGKTKRKYNAILFGYNRIGFSILKSLKKIGKNYLVIDYNPDTISDLTKFNIPALYGDVEDSEFVEELPLDDVELAVSTVPDFETNMLLINSIRSVNPKAIIVVRAHQISEAMELYARGATYVLTPHFLGGEYVSKMIAEKSMDIEEYRKERKKHMRMLSEMAARGQEHPEVERN